MAYVICEPCVDVKDTACVKVCPVDCIYEFEGERQLYIHPQECIDCGACMPECPVQAIFPEANVPDQWRSYIEKNRLIFETRSVAKTPQPSAETPPTPTLVSPSTREWSRERVLRVLQAVEEGTLDPEIALIQFTGAPAAFPKRPASSVATVVPAREMPETKPAPQVDPRVPSAVAERIKIVPEGYGRVAEEDEDVAIEVTPVLPKEPPIPRPNLEVRGFGGFLLRVLQPFLGALRAKEKYLLEGYASPSVFSASFATWLNGGLNVFLYGLIAVGLAASLVGEGWESSGLLNLLLVLGVGWGIAEGSVRVWSALFDPSAPPHRQYGACVYGWLVTWLVWPLLEAMVRPAARPPQPSVKPPEKPIPGGEVHLEDELEKRRRYGMVHEVTVEGNEYIIRLEMPRKTPVTARTAKLKLPGELPDYRIEVWTEGEVVHVQAILDDPRFAEVAGRDAGFPASFLTSFKLEGANSHFQKKYDPQTKVLTVRVGRREEGIFLEDRVSGAAA